MTDQRTALAPLQLGDVDASLYVSVKEGDWDAVELLLDEVLRNAGDDTLTPADQMAWSIHASRILYWLEGDDELELAARGVEYAE